MGVDPGADVVAAGLATHLVPSQHLKILQQRLLDLGDRVGDHAAVGEVISSLQVHSMTAH